MRTLASRLSLAAAAAGLLVAAGCGGADTAAPGGSATAPPATPAGGIAHATGPTDVVLRVAEGGGFVPIEFSLRGLPSYTLYGDGTVIRQATPAGGATQEPPITPLETLRLDEAAIQNLLGQAKSAGLLGAGTIDYGDMGAVGVSDMPTTSVTLTAAGSTASHDAYALSAPADASSGRMTPAQVAARAALRGFVALVEQPGPHAKPYAPTRLAVFIAPAAAPPAAGSAPVAWPLAAVPALAKADANGNGYSCSVVEGADVAPLVDAVTKAPIGAQWIAAADRNAPFQVVVRPLLPDEAGCPAA